MAARFTLVTPRLARSARAPPSRAFASVATACRASLCSQPPGGRTCAPAWVAAACRTARAGARPYSANSSDDHHETSPRGTKLWTFEQMQRASKGGSKVVIVDTREPGELVQTGRIPGAINIPITTHPESFHIPEEEFESRFDFGRPGRDEELVFYCKAGVRSRAAASLAKEAGWTNVGEYPGSWLDWEKNGGEAENGGK